MTDEERIRRLELAVAALADMLEDSNPHIARELHEMAQILGDEDES